MKPILKWAGGKRKLLAAIETYIDRASLQNHAFFEPFVGGGALFLDLACPTATINDFNEELINVYTVIRDNPDELIRLLRRHARKHSHDYYYEIRNIDRSDDFKKMTPIQRAARTIYLNRTCYNGLYRVNSKGQFNVPFGRYVNPEIVNEEKIRELSAYFRTNQVSILNGDFSFAVQNAQAGDTVYFDPPYDYEDNGFTAYTANGFTREDLRRLKLTCDELIERGCRIIVSNNDTTFVNQIFDDPHYAIEHVATRWTISRNGRTRRIIGEVIIHG